MHYRRWTVLALSLLVAAPALGLTPRLVKDIDPLPLADSSSPFFMARSGNLSYFLADDGQSGEELWRTDGTEAGTFQVADTCPGACSGRPFSVAATGDLYFFSTREAAGERSLWVTKGTPATTFRLTDGIDVTPFVRTVLWRAGVLYFAAYDDVHGSELWRSDGTVAGTFLVADVRPGPESSRPAELTDFGGRLFFRADHGAGNSLWKSDGTARGTRLVRDPLPAVAVHRGVSLLRTVGKSLFFTAPAPRGGVTQLWKSDGTTRGTSVLTDLKPNPFVEPIVDATVLGNRLLFVTNEAAGQELWVSDGTLRGTRAITAFDNPDAFLISTGNLTLPQNALGNRILFRVDDGEHGIELWTTDGTPKGTRLLKDVCPGSCTGAGDGVAAGGRWYFAAGDGARGFEAWVTDGTEAGTRMLRDICRGACGSFPFGFFAIGDRVYFLARPDPAVSLYQLWRSDGTLRSTILLASVEPYNLSFPVIRSSAGNVLVFAAADPQHGRELWRSDGTAQGTRLLADINRGDLGGSFPRELMTAGGQLYFLASLGGQPAGLWKSDGTDAGTRFVDDLEEAGPPVREVYSYAEVDGRLVFSVPRSSTSDQMLWASDGTADGTLPLLPDGVRPTSDLRTVGNQVFFVGRDSVHGEELWVTDGTPAGTRLVADLITGEGGSLIFRLTAFNNRLYFQGGGGFRDQTLWTSDGTASGTFPVVAPNELSLNSPLTVHAGRLWFIGHDDIRGSALWSTDGSAAGTVPEVDLLADSSEFIPYHLVSAGSRLFFAGGFLGKEGSLWVTDGTAGGTHRVGSWDLWSGGEMFGFEGSVYYNVSGSGELWTSDGDEEGPDVLRDRDGEPIELPGYSPRLAVQFVAGRFYFVDDAGSLYESDGTPAGTSAILEGVGPKPVAIGGCLFFSHRDRETGNELWVLE